MERKAQIEALWTYEVATEKVLRRSVKKSGKGGRNDSAS